MTYGSRKPLKLSTAGQCLKCFGDLDKYGKCPHCDKKKNKIKSKVETMFKEIIKIESFLGRYAEQFDLKKKSPRLGISKSGCKSSQGKWQYKNYDSKKEE